MNSRFTLVNNKNKRDYMPNSFDKNRRKPTTNRPLFQKDKVKTMHSKSSFNDSDYDCRIIKESTNDPIETTSSTLKTNPFGSSFHKSRVTTGIPISFQPRGTNYVTEDISNSSGVYNNNFNNQYVNKSIEKVAPISSQTHDTDSTADIDCNSEKNTGYQPTGIYHTSEERHKLLEELDNCLISSSETMKLDRPLLTGTCQDMCPEKERYNRGQNDTGSIYESDDNGVFDHNKAVKDYERCSADKKEPPPHELRTTETLDRTINFLLKNVIDSNVEGDASKGSWRQWYMFLFSRTRAIRKDITQQNLCNLTVIKIIEIITRFHIFCAERLCEESKDVFEHQLNEENLKNSLQSLKDMYRDMPRNSCRNEAEFRSYMLIMNIDKVEILDEVHKLSLSVLQSEEVRFAISVYRTVQTENYVRFFRLIQNADFITSCLMHRFIASMRLRAFRVINKAYVANKSGDNQVPLGYFTKILGFESNEEAGSFCKKLGLLLEGDPSNIILNGYFNLPDTLDDFVKRSNKLVEIKQGNRRLSNLFTGDDELKLDIDFPPCKMVSFSDRSRYIGKLKFPSEKMCSENIVKLRQVQSKDNFDLSDSDYNIKSDSIPKSRINVDLSQKVSFVSSTTTSAQEPGHNINIFSTASTNVVNIFGPSLKGSGSIPQNSIFSTMAENAGIFVKPNLFSNSSALFSKSGSTDIKMCDDIDTSISPNVTKSPFINSIPSNQTTDLNPVSFYLQPSEEEIRCESNQLIEVGPIFTEEDVIMLADDLNSELVKGLIEETCDNILKTEYLKNYECDQILKEIIYESTNESVVEECYFAREDYVDIQTEQYLQDLILEVSWEYCQKALKSSQEKELLRQKRNFTLKRTYFHFWQVYTACNIADRRSMAKLPSAPRMVDDFTICEDFRGKVRKISTDGFVSSDVHSIRHPVMQRLEQCTNQNSDNFGRKFVSKNISTQTNMSYANIKTFTVYEYVRDNVEKRFINILDQHISTLEFAKQVDPTPEAIISDYNSLIDSIHLAISAKINIPIASAMKLPTLCLSEQPVPQWTSYLQTIFAKLEIPQQFRVLLLEEIYMVLKYLDNSQELPELSYYHLRLMPWIKTIKYAVINKLSIIHKQFADIAIDVTTNCMEVLDRLQLENTLGGLSIDKCVSECDKHRQRYVPRVIKSPTMKHCRRLSAFQQLMTKVAELEKSIDDGK